MFVQNAVGLSDNLILQRQDEKDPLPRKDTGTGEERRQQSSEDNTVVSQANFEE